MRAGLKRRLTHYMFTTTAQEQHNNNNCAYMTTWSAFFVVRPAVENRRRFQNSKMCSRPSKNGACERSLKQSVHDYQTKVFRLKHILYISVSLNFFARGPLLASEINQGSSHHCSRQYKSVRMIGI